MSISVDSERYARLIVKILLIAFVLIIVLNVFAIIFYFKGTLDNEIGYKVFKKLYVDYESNLPSFFNLLLFLISSFFLFLVFVMSRNANKKHKFYWLFLSVVFLFLSLDESASVHEFFNTVTPRIGVGGSGYFYFAWVIPYAIFVLIFFLITFKFLRELNKITAFGFVLAGVIFVTGALGVEMLGAKIASTIGVKNIKYALVSTVEESLEMGGLIIFIFHILKYIRMEFKSVTVKFS